MDLSKANLERLARSEGQDFDLVIVDYRLRADYDGARVLRDFRRRMKFTEMVFYTGGPEADLYREVADAKIDGVFIARRDDLDDALQGIADIVIKKAVDLTHTRGLAMAEVADIDALMARTIRSALGGDITPCLKKQADRVRKGLKKDKERAVRKLVEGLDGGVLGVLDHPLFDAHQKWRAVRKLAECLDRVPEDELRTVGGYGDLLKKRNKLAHVQATEENGLEVLRSDTGTGQVGIVIDDVWMSELRGELREQREAMEVVCAAIETEFGDERGQKEEGEAQA